MKFWKKNQTLLFLDTAETEETPAWARVGLSTVLDIALNAATEDYDFIINENPTTIVEKYQPSLSQEIMAQEGDSCFDYIWGLFYSMPTGSGAETDCLIAFPKAGTAPGSFDAWKMKATLILNNFDAVAKKITFEIKTSGDTAPGTVSVKDGAPTFVAAV